MTKSKVFPAAVALTGAMMFASCNVNDDIQENVNRAVRFSGNIDGQVAVVPAIRAAGTTWGADAIGVCMVSHGTPTVVENAVNRKYTTDGSGTFMAVAGEEIFYPQAGKVDFIAYYPYTAGVTLDSPIDVTIGEQTDATQPTFDLLYAKANNAGSGYAKDYSGAVALTFGHKLAKLVMNCRTGDGVTSLDGMTVRIEGMNTKSTFDLATGMFGTAEVPAAVIPRKIAAATDFEASYDAIILPGNYGANALKVIFSIGADDFVWNVEADDAVFEGGNEYVYEVIIRRTGVSVAATINPWTVTDRGEVVAE